MKKSKNKQQRLFKDDPFGLKEIYFKYRIKRVINKGVRFRIQALKVYLKGINTIHVPSNDEEKELLKDLIGRFDKTIEELNKSIRYSRLSIEDIDE